MLRRIEKLLVDLSICAVLALGLLITANVFLRAAFNSGIPDSTVIVAELMVAAIILPLAATTAKRAHITVEFVSNYMPIRVRSALTIFGTLFGLLALTPLIWAGWRETVGAIEKSSFFFGELMLPKWPGRLIFLIGMGICWLRLSVMVITDIGRMRRGESLFDPTGGQ